MNFVQPIRERFKIFEIEKYLADKHERYRIMFQIGIYSGLRISDIIKLRVCDVRGKDYITLRETKTRKERRVKLKKALQKLIREYCEGRQDYEYLILSAHGKNEPISRSTAYAVIKDAGKQAGIENLGTHSMRKTFGYHYYRQTGDIVTLQKLFNHAAPSITLRYIGIDQDKLDSAIDSFEY